MYHWRDICKKNKFTEVFSTKLSSLQMAVKGTEIELKVAVRVKFSRHPHLIIMRMVQSISLIILPF